MAFVQTILIIHCFVKRCVVGSNIYVKNFQIYSIILCFFLCQKIILYQKFTKSNTLTFYFCFQKLLGIAILLNMNIILIEHDLNISHKIQHKKLTVCINTSVVEDLPYMEKYLRSCLATHTHTHNINPYPYIPTHIYTCTNTHTIHIYAYPYKHTLKMFLKCLFYRYI